MRLKANTVGGDVGGGMRVICRVEDVNSNAVYGQFFGRDAAEAHMNVFQALRLLSAFGVIKGDFKDIYEALIDREEEVSL